MKTSYRGEAGNPAIRAEKKIRTAHTKEKQQIRQACYRPNRLNLLNWTARHGLRSNFFTKA